MRVEKQLTPTAKEPKEKERRLMMKGNFILLLGGKYVVHIKFSLQKFSFLNDPHSPQRAFIFPPLSKMAQLQLLQSLTLNSTTRFFPSRNPSLNPPVLTRRAISPFFPARRFPRPESICPMSRFHHLCRMKNSDIISQLELGKPDGKRVPDKQVNGVFWILLLNIGIYVADHWFQLPLIKTLYFYHARPAWYQFVTSTFCHATWNHLSSNLFFLYIFGKLVEEEEGTFALWTSYILTGAGANLVSWLVLPRNAVSVGASGAVFGLFAISVLVKIRWDWRKILEVLILGQFVIQKVMEAAQASAGLSGSFNRGYYLQNINHIAHLSGALVGVALVLLISTIPTLPSDHDIQVEKEDK